MSGFKRKKRGHCLIHSTVNHCYELMLKINGITFTGKKKKHEKNDTLLSNKKSDNISIELLSPNIYGPREETATFFACIVCIVLPILLQCLLYHMSFDVRKPVLCICENKDTDQLRGNREADQRLCFRCTDSTIPLLPTSKISSL